MQISYKMVSNAHDAAAAAAADKTYLISGLMRLIRPLARKNMLISREK